MIPIRNVYYMLSYAFQTLREQGYRDVATEEFRNVADLCAAILAKGVAAQIKRGLTREYLERAETLACPRGRIDFSESVKTLCRRERRLACVYDDFSVNCYMNRIIRTAMGLLLRADIARERKKALRKLLVFFDGVEPLDPRFIDWHMRFNRNNQAYRMLVAVCYLTVKGLLQTTSDGGSRVMDFLDEQNMCRLYEKFLLEYYRKEFPRLSAKAAQIRWALDGDAPPMLPLMLTDVTLQYGADVLIIDAKYYNRTTQALYGSHVLHSGNLYQIFSYVKNKEAELAGRPHTVSGMLLYARTDAEVQPDADFSVSGNRFAVKTLDLNREFSEIAAQLDAIAQEYLHCEKG